MSKGVVIVVRANMKKNTNKHAHFESWSCVIVIQICLFCTDRDRGEVNCVMLCTCLQQKPKTVHGGEFYPRTAVR